jgi:Xaa-Pro aminopeptidase
MEVTVAISREELSRRHEGIRALMGERGMDCLVIAGRSDYFSRGNIRYVTNLPLGGFAVFPAGGKAIYFLSRNQIASPKHEQAGPIREFLDLKEIYDPVEQVVLEASRLSEKGRIGVVGMNDIPLPVYLALKDRFGERLVDGTPIFSLMRGVKSNEEIALMRKAALVADRVHDLLIEMIRPGLVDYEIYGSVKKAIYEMACDYSMELIDAHGSTMNMAWSPSGERLDEHGTLFLEITPAFEGYYAQLPVCLPVGDYSPSVQPMVGAWKEAMKAAVPLLRPGTVVGDIHKAAVSIIEQRGFISPFPAGHALGLDVIDFWTVQPSNATVLQPGMALAFHPCVLREMGGEGIGMGYTYLITSDGAEKLSSVELAP